MKRFTTLSVAVCMLIATLSGCSGNKAANADTANPTTTPPPHQTEITAESNQTESTSATTTTANTPTTTKRPASSTTPTKNNNSTSKASTTKTVKRSTKYEVDKNSVKSISGATVERAWKLSENGVDVEIHRIAYGNKITQRFIKGKGGFEDLYDYAIDYEKSVTYQPYANVAIVTASPEKLRISSAQQLLGTDHAKVQNMASKAGALIAINCEPGKSYSNPGRPFSIVRNGVVVKELNSDSLVRPLRIFRDGSPWTFDPVTYLNSASLIEQGLYHTVRYQDVLLKDGVIKTSLIDEYHHNRTAIAQISENKYILICGEFMPLVDMAEILLKYGARTAVLTNGGNCSEMYVKGIGNTTGTTGKMLVNCNKVNVLETEFFGTHGLLANGKKGEECYECDILYFK